eukprot:scaffold6702_cov390-Prasinococcus_capsulatus_cf.AAC.2
MGSAMEFRKSIHIWLVDPSSEGREEVSSILQQCAYKGEWALLMGPWIPLTNVPILYARASFYGGLLQGVYGQVK